MKLKMQNEYRYLWDGSELGWVLLREPELLGGFCVYNKIRRALLHIEREDVNAAICLKMKQAGAEVLDEIPPDDVQVRPLTE